MSRCFYSGDQLYNSPAWAEETMDWAVRWNRLNRHLNVIELAGSNLWNGHRLEERIITRCITIPIEDVILYVGYMYFSLTLLPHL